MAIYPLGDPSRPSHIFQSDEPGSLDPFISQLPPIDGAGGPASLGLLLDVDGPIASPVTRSVVAPGLARDLTALANAHVPIGFNTGRSDEFLRREVLPALQAHGLRSDAPVWGISEKAGTWFSFAQPDNLEIDQNLQLPQALRDDLRTLLTTQFAELAFYDETKHTMVSFEQHTTISNEYFQAHRDEMELAVAALVASHGLAYVWEGRPDRDWAPPGYVGPPTVRIDPTIIATDVEHMGTGKDTGAARFLELLKGAGLGIPGTWRTMGDSRTDYAMATWLAENGYEVAHVDVRPSDGVLDVGVPVLTHLALIHDLAGAAFLKQWTHHLLGR